MILFVLNIIDGLLTFIGIKLGYLAEVNIIFEGFGDSAFLFLKLGIGSVMIILADRFRYISIINKLFVTVTGIYSLVFLYHIAIIYVVDRHIWMLNL